MDPGDWYSSLPKFTKWWLTSTLALSVAGRLSLVHPYQMILSFDRIFNNFEIWRPITALLYYPITPATGFHFLVNCYFLYNYSIRLETGEFDGRPADYCYMLLINWFFCTVLAYFTQTLLLMDCMVLSVLYVWCQLNKDTIVTFWFGTVFKAIYLPWALFIFNYFLSNGGTTELMGILVGHIYYFLRYSHPQESGTQSFLTTPSFLYSMFPSRSGGTSFGVPPSRAAPAASSPRQAPARSGGHNWGRGRVLGASID